MLYTEKEKNEIERVRKVFEKHIQQMTGYDLVWSDKVGYVWLAISIDPVYIDTGNWIESAAGLCYECLNDIALDVFGMTGNDHDFEDADPLELAEIKRRWKPYIDQLPEYAHLCDELLAGENNPSAKVSGAKICFWHFFCGFFVNLIKKSLTTRFGG